MYKLLVLLLFISQIGFSQNSKDTFYIENKPVSKGYILKYKEGRFGVTDPSRFIIINSLKKEVFAINPGIVKTTFSIDSDSFIGVESEDTFILYGKIKSMKKKGDSVLSGEKIGDLYENENNCYKLVLSITILKELSAMNYLEIFNFLVGRFGSQN